MEVGTFWRLLGVELGCDTKDLLAFGSVFGGGWVFRECVFILAACSV